MFLFWRYFYSFCYFNDRFERVFVLFFISVSGKAQSSAAENISINLLSAISGLVSLFAMSQLQLFILSLNDFLERLFISHLNIALYDFYLDQSLQWQRKKQRNVRKYQFAKYQYKVLQTSIHLLRCNKWKFLLHMLP